MNIRTMFPRKYASGEDLNGRPVVLTIASVRPERMTPPGAAPVEKYVVYFKGAERGVVLSRLLAEQIAAATGFDDTEHWPGKAVTLYPETIKVAGVERVVIRARKVNPERVIPPGALTVNGATEAGDDKAT